MGSATGFHVRVLAQGELGPTWSAMFSDLAVEPVSAGTTLIHGEVPDQAALHGLLATIRDLGLSVISVEAGVIPDTPSQEQFERGPGPRPASLSGMSRVPIRKTG